MAVAEEHGWEAESVVEVPGLEEVVEEAAGVQVVELERWVVVADPEHLVASVDNRLVV